ncbi:DUF805 domain-containing protein [Desulfovibrio sp. SGI.169]|uniref:DUF805 domain-containing protein n=1 Tax=Desulfovibrio sp. SGI.169 TaxID=3420561 RepID=UPI003D045FBB
MTHDARAESLPPGTALPVFRQRRMSFTEAIASCLKNAATFRGRATRAEYWWFTLFSSLVSTAVNAVFMNAGEYGEPLSALFQLALFLPGLTVGARRLHDTGRSGWWLLASLTLVGILPLCIFFCLRSQQTPNKYGDVPLAARQAP